MDLITGWVQTVINYNKTAEEVVLPVPPRISSGGHVFSWLPESSPAMSRGQPAERKKERDKHENAKDSIDNFSSLNLGERICPGKLFSSSEISFWCFLFFLVGQVEQLPLLPCLIHDACRESFRWSRIRYSCCQEEENHLLSITRDSNAGARAGQKCELCTTLQASSE